MSCIVTHYDGYEIKRLSLSENFVCFAPPNDFNSVFIMKIYQIRLYSEENSLSKYKPKMLCNEPYEVKILKHVEFGNMIYVLTYDGHVFRVRRSNISTDENITFG